MKWLIQTSPKDLHHFPEQVTAMHLKGPHGADHYALLQRTCWHKVQMQSFKGLQGTVSAMMMIETNRGRDDASVQPKQSAGA